VQGDKNCVPDEEEIIVVVGVGKVNHLNIVIVKALIMWFMEDAQ